MKILLKYLFNNIKENILRSILIVLSIAVASSVFYMCMNIYDDTLENTIKIFQNTTKGYDLLIKDYNDNLLLPECEDILKIERKEYEHEITDDMNVNIKANITDVSKLLDSNLLEIALDKKELKDNDAIISRQKALYYNLGVGDCFEINDETITIVGICKSFGIFADNNTNTIEVFINKSKINDNITILKLANDDLDNSFNYIITNNNCKVDYLYDSLGSSSDQTKIKMIMFVILLLTMFMIGYVVISTMQLLINYRIHIFGTFRSIGASKKQVLLILILESIIYSLLGGVSGLIIGEITRYVTRTKIFNIGLASVEPTKMLCVLCFSLIFGVLITLIAAKKSSKTSIIEMITTKQNTFYNYPNVLGIIGIVFAVISIVLAKRNISFNYTTIIIELFLAIIGAALLCGLVCKIFKHLLSRSLIHKNGSIWFASISVGSSSISVKNTTLLAIAISLVLTIYAGIGSISAYLDKYSKSYSYDIMIKNLNADKDYYSYLNNLDCINKIEYEYWKNNTVTINNTTKKISLVSNNGITNGIYSEKIDLSKLKNNEVIIDKMFCIKNNLKIGDTIKIENPYKYEAKIVDYCDSSIYNNKRFAIIMTQNDYEKYIQDIPAIIGIYVNGNIDNAINKICDANYSKGEFDLSIFTKEQYMNKELSLALKSIGIVVLIPILVLILSLLGIINYKLISFIQNKQQYAILNSNTMSRKQIINSIIYENIFSFLIAIIIGVSLSAWLINVFRDLVFSTIGYISITINPYYVFISFVVLFILMYISTLIQIRKLKKFDIIKEIRYE